uniref:Uncharacterized protein n=1 Tax=Haemonchus contortus TaxID=6289 RepID=W6NCB5_HAECO
MNCSVPSIPDHMGERRNFANSRDWDRHETAKLVYATTDCPFIPDGSFWRKIGGSMSKGGRLFDRLNFVGATTSRYHSLTEPYRSVHGNRLFPVFQSSSPTFRADSVRCSPTIVILRRPTKTQTPFFDALARTFDFLVAGPSSEAAILRRSSTFDSSWTSHHWTSIFSWNHPIRSTTLVRCAALRRLVGGDIHSVEASFIER